MLSLSIHGSLYRKAQAVGAVGQALQFILAHRGGQLGGRRGRGGPHIGREVAQGHVRLMAHTAHQRYR